VPRYKKKKTMKRFSIATAVLASLLLILLLIITFDLSSFWGKEANSGKNNDIPNTAPITDDTDEEPEGVKSVITHIYGAASLGKSAQTPFEVGHTHFHDVVAQWGDPNNSEEINNRTYAEYTEEKITLGYEDDVVKDIRSYNSQLNQIRYKDILDILGQPTETKRYQDERHNQVILIYNTNSDYQLKWIIPKESEMNESLVDHISIISLEEPAPGEDVADHEENHDMIPKTVTNMTLNEKIGQLLFVGISGTSLNQNDLNLIQKYKVGGLILYSHNLVDTTQSVNLLNSIKNQNSTNAIPLFLGVDQEGGNVSRLPSDILTFPTNEQIGRINSEEYSYDIGKTLGEELNAFGFNLNFAPVLDVNSNPDNPVIGNRSFSPDANIVSRLGTATLKGLQSQKIIPVVKHFPGHGDTKVDSHLALPIVHKDLSKLSDTELVPFKHAIKNKADAVMVAHILLPEIDSEYPATLSHTVITDILRKELNFNGVVITDDMTMGAIKEHYSISKAVVKSINAGSDIVLVAHNYNSVVTSYNSLVEAVQNGTISEERINKSVTRILNLKKKYNINNKQVNKVDIGQLNNKINQVNQKYSN
jgi:beta-N-acetylhexosaminidase